MDVLTKEQRHKNMLAIKSKDTKIEISLRTALWHKGVRYRKNKKLFNCHPDLVITKYKIAVFCDGDFWHGKTFERYEVTTNAKFWHEKIQRNVERDLENTIELRDNGWIVLRFWETDIKKNLDLCVEAVLHAIKMREATGNRNF
ncbi:very short patch repair endonuclease [uncultured Phascolarctobacterium sp.]|uniref:very short patch repair endonuclease n=1 Tax=uncultured Phascolarctobacterium sp. TaxID=512296 RepID=UPI0025E500B3|nr:very short patch repair endonuclease [uncultured Phascolarctobacterium sp.]